MRTKFCVAIASGSHPGYCLYMFTDIPGFTLFILNSFVNPSCFVTYCCIMFDMSDIKLREGHLHMVDFADIAHVNCGSSLSAPCHGNL